MMLHRGKSIRTDFLSHLAFLHICNDLIFNSWRWLYKEATVQEVHDGDDDCTANVKVVISAAAYGRYKKLFQVT
ncbi:putative GTP-binding protein 6 isoform X4 [Tachysurus ichikawai]